MQTEKRRFIRFRDIERELISRGWTQVRSTKHKIWRHLDGSTISIPGTPQTDLLGGPVVKKILSKELL